jgi:hypothetical protein
MAAGITDPRLQRAPVSVQIAAPGGTLIQFSQERKSTSRERLSNSHNCHFIVICP